MGTPETLFFRHGLDQLAAALAARGARRVLLLAAPSRRFVDEVAAALAAFAPAELAEARLHVPAEVVERAEAALAATGADTLVAVGGGSAIGLGKALRLGHPVGFACVPTTYSGSEMTSMYGITRGNDKRTGRDDRVRPDVVLYDAELTVGLPIGLSVQSLMNGVAHVVSALSTGSLGDEDRGRAAATVAGLLAAIDALLAAPRDLGAREAAQRHASAAGGLIDRGKAGAQHALAHLLGGGLGLDHAALHAVLLPHFVAHVRATQPGLVEALERAAGVADLAAALLDRLAAAGAPTTLAALGADAGAVARLLATRPELPAGVAAAAQGQAAAQ